MNSIFEYLKRILFSTIIVVTLVLPMAYAQAENGLEYSLSGSLIHFDYQEFSDAGKLFDREEGFIPGLAFGLSNKADQWVFAGDFAYHTGSVPYTGNTNTGIPIKTTTRQNIWEAGLRGEYWLQSDKGTEYAVYIGTNYHRWERDILSTTTPGGAYVSGLFEIYTWWTGFAGMKGEIYHSGADSLLLDIRLLRTFIPEIKVSEYDNLKLTLGERWGGRLALPWRSKLNEENGLLVEPFVEYFEFGRSAIDPLTGVYEPFSKTLNYGLTAGVTRKF